MTLQAPQRVTDARSSVSGGWGLSKPFRALVESCGACDGAGQLQMPIPDPRCDRTERFRCRRYIASLAALSGFLKLTVNPLPQADFRKPTWAGPGL